jgi:prepilin-type N-terminal cleavage/methylation domain-containing protein
VQPPPEAGSRDGFTLLEALVAMIVMALALLLGYGFMMRQPQVMQRLDAGDEALRAIEASVETLRAGAIPLKSGFLEPGIAYPPPHRAAHLVVDLEVTSTDVPGLYALNVEARYRVGRSIHRRRIETLLWSP